jgi:hypothetical protein
MWNWLEHHAHELLGPYLCPLKDGPEAGPSRELGMVKNCARAQLPLIPF